MNTAIVNVLERKNDIIRKTMEYENKNIPSNEFISLKDITDDNISYSELFNFFDKNFNDDEIMVIQSIMYFGRECYVHDNYICGKTIEDIISIWMKELSFAFGKSIKKNIEIHQMVEKGLKIGTYFKLGFENLK